MECVMRCVGAEYREGCYEDYCTDCRVRKLEKDDWDGCSECAKEVAPVLAAQNKKLQEEVEKLHQE